jgi:hypothetical protein
MQTTGVNTMTGQKVIDTAFSAFMARIKEQHPELSDGWQCEWIGISIDQIEADPCELVDLIGDHVFDPHATEQIISENIVNCRVPKGYLLTRITKEGEEPLIVMIAMPETEVQP